MDPDDRLMKLQLPDTLRLSDSTLNDLSKKLIPDYDAWQAERDLRAIYTNATFHRRRNALLPYGIDIAHTRPRAVVLQDEYLAGVPLRSFLGGPGVSPPERAKEVIAA